MQHDKLIFHSDGAPIIPPKYTLVKIRLDRATLMALI